MKETKRMTQDVEDKLEKIADEGKVKNKYIFPNVMAKVMAKIDMRTQFEASMMSMTLIFLGMVASIIYLPIYTDFGVVYKVFLVVNLLAGMGFISSFLVTTYQQYQSYMEHVDFQKEMKGGTLK